MTDVAAEAGVSRATLYLRFRDKRTLFDELAALLVTDALTAVETAWTVGVSLAGNFEETILAEDLPMFRILHASPHGAVSVAPASSPDRAFEDSPVWRGGSG